MITKGIIFVFLSTVLWGIPQPLLFNEIKHISPIEIISHRGLWSFLFLLIIILFVNKISNFFFIFKNLKLLVSLLITSLLLAFNWLGFVISISLERLQDASLGYYISPIISIILGYFFLKEEINKLKFVSIILMILAILLLIFNYGKVPYIAIFIGLSWAAYGLIRKKINIIAEVGLLFETFIITIFALPYLLNLLINNNGYFFYSTKLDTYMLILTGVFTAMPLFFFNTGVRYIPLGIAGSVFFLTPTFHFLTSVLILNEDIDLTKILSFIIIWIAVVIFIWDKLKKIT